MLLRVLEPGEKCLLGPLDNLDANFRVGDALLSEDGSHFAVTLATARDIFRFFPWFDTRPGARLPLDFPDDRFLHRYVLDMLLSGPHYSADTVQILARQNPGACLYYVMGGDSLHDLPTWNKPQDFIQTCTGIGVMRRHADQVDLESLEKILPGITAKVHIVEAPILEISSKQIRQRIEESMGYRYYLRDAVYQAITEMGMYK